jgi:predicted AlkP superfamily pyrophosphatase or phosphodiesterase
MKGKFHNSLLLSASFLADNCISRTRISQQEADDFGSEIARLELLKCYYYVLSAPTFKSLFSYYGTGRKNEFAESSNKVSSILNGWFFLFFLAIIRILLFVFKLFSLIQSIKILSNRLCFCLIKSLLHFYS